MSSSFYVKFQIAVGEVLTQTHPERSEACGLLAGSRREAI